MHNRYRRGFLGLNAVGSGIAISAAATRQSSLLYYGVRAPRWDSLSEKEDLSLVPAVITLLRFNISATK